MKSTTCQHKHTNDGSSLRIEDDNLNQELRITILISFDYGVFEFACVGVFFDDTLTVCCK